MDNLDFLGPAFSAERWAYAGRMTLLGMTATFLVLSLLWLVLVIFRVLMERSDKKAKSQDVKTPAGAVVSPEVAVQVSDNDDEALIAVITAALEAYRASESDSEYSGAFRVVSFRRVQGKGAWNAGK
jgi:sodium pump decarboxylase gamma subunit